MKYALGILDIELEARSNWNTKALALVLMRIHSTAEFTTESASAAFGQACHNFEVYCLKEGKTGLGRNQFKEWFTKELSHQVTLASISATPAPTGITDDPPWEVDNLPLTAKSDIAVQPKKQGKWKNTETKTGQYTGWQAEAMRLMKVNEALEEENAGLKDKVMAAEKLAEKLQSMVNSFKAVLKA